MNDFASALMTLGRQETCQDTPGLGTVKGDRFATFADLRGKAVRCTAGHLWVTLENDVMDHILRADESFTISAAGKVIVGGKGCYAIVPSERMPLAS